MGFFMADEPGRSEPLGDAFRYNPDYHRVAEFLGVDKYDREDYGTASKISIIRDWAGIQSKSETTEGALLAIDDLRKQLGFQFIGKPLVNEMYKAIRLEMDTARANVLYQPIPPKTKKEKGTIEEAITEAVQGTITEVVKKAIQAKDFVEKSITGAVQEAVKNE